MTEHLTGSSPMQDEVSRRASEQGGALLQIVGGVQKSHEPRSEEALSYLLRGELPPDQAGLLADSGYSDYVLGINQSGARTGEDAVRTVAESNGISIGGWDIGQHFVLFDKAYQAAYDPDAKRLKDDLTEGYFRDPSNYRFIVAFPVEHEVRAEHEEFTAARFGASYKRGEHPDDFFVQNPANTNGRSVNHRYIAGYLDETQAYRVNPGFMSKSSLH